MITLVQLTKKRSSEKNYIKIKLKPLWVALKKVEFV